MRVVPVYIYYVFYIIVYYAICFFIAVKWVNDNNCKENEFHRRDVLKSTYHYVRTFLLWHTVMLSIRIFVAQFLEFVILSYF